MLRKEHSLGYVDTHPEENFIMETTKHDLIMECAFGQHEHQVEHSNISQCIIFNWFSFVIFISLYLYIYVLMYLCMYLFITWSCCWWCSGREQGWFSFFFRRACIYVLNGKPFSVNKLFILLSKSGYNHKSPYITIDHWIVDPLFINYILIYNCVIVMHV